MTGNNRLVLIGQNLDADGLRAQLRRVPCAVAYSGAGIASDHTKKRKGRRHRHPVDRSPEPQMNRLAKKPPLVIKPSHGSACSAHPQSFARAAKRSPRPSPSLTKVPVTNVKLTRTLPARCMAEFNMPIANTIGIVAVSNTAAMVKQRHYRGEDRGQMPMSGEVGQQLTAGRSDNKQDYQNQDLNRFRKMAAASW